MIRAGTIAAGTGGESGGDHVGCAVYGGHTTASPVGCTTGLAAS